MVSTFFSKHKTILLLLLILAVASFFRLYGLETIPPGLYPDEAINGNQAISEPGKIFYPENNGREGFFMGLISLSFGIFGISIWSLKIVPAIIGIFTVLGLYLLTRELFSLYAENGSRRLAETRSRLIALFSSFFLATSFWHINFSRIEFRAILVPFVLVFSFYFLFRGFRTTLLRPPGYEGREKIWNFILAGAIFGLGFHTYIAFRVAVLLLAITLFLWWLVYKKQNLQKQFLCFMFYVLCFMILVALPIGIYFLQNPTDFMGRASGVSIFAQPNLIIAGGESLITHLAMFNFFGDYNWRHNISGSPILFWPVGILFLIGLSLSIKELIASYRLKKCFMFYVSPKESCTLPTGQACFMISWFFIMLLPGILTSEGIPHSLRCIGAIPPIFIFSGIGAEFLYRKFFYSNVFKNIRIGKSTILICVLLITCFTYAQYNRYFEVWAKNPNVENAFSKNYVEIGNYLNSLPTDTQKYVIVNQGGVLVDGIPMPAQTVMFIENTKREKPRTRTPNESKLHTGQASSVRGKQKTIYLLPENINQIQMKANSVIVPMHYDEELFRQLQIIFPQGAIQEKNGIYSFQ